MRCAAMLLCGVLAGCGETAGETPLEPLFSFALIADPHITADADREARLAAAVRWIDDHATERGIELVFALGDLGWGGGLERSKELLDELTVPYVPLRGDNEIAAGEDAGYQVVYGPRYDALATTLQDWRKAPTPVKDPETEVESWLQNVGFTHRGVRFYTFDWCIRAEEGILAEFGELHDYPGGSLDWFRKDVAGVDARVNGIVMMSHIPMFLGAFEHDEMDAIAAITEPRDAEVYANFAGHLHGDLDMASPGFEVHAIDAVWDDDITIRVVDVSGDGRSFAYTQQNVIVSLP